MMLKSFVLVILTFWGQKSLFRLYDLLTILSLSLFANILAQEKINFNMPIDCILLAKYISSLLSIVFFYLIHNQYVESYAVASSYISSTSKPPSELYKNQIDADVKRYGYFYTLFIFFTFTFVILTLFF